MPCICFLPTLLATNMLLLPSSLLLRLPQWWNSARLPPKPPSTAPSFPSCSTGSSKMQHSPCRKKCCSPDVISNLAMDIWTWMDVWSTTHTFCGSFMRFPLNKMTNCCVCFQQPQPTRSALTHPEPCWNSHSPHGANRIQSSFSVYTSKTDVFHNKYHTSHQHPGQGEAVLLVSQAVSSTVPDQTAGGMLSFPGLRLEHHITLSHCENTILLYQEDFFSLPFLNFGAALSHWQGALPKYTAQDSVCGSGSGAWEGFSTQPSTAPELHSHARCWRSWIHLPAAGNAAASWAAPLAEGEEFCLKPGARDEGKKLCCAEDDLPSL